MTTPAPLTQSETTKHTKKRAAYNQWVDRYGQILYRYVYWILRDAEQAVSMTQHTFSKVWTHFDDVSNGKNPKVRLFGFMYSELVNNSENNQPPRYINTQSMIDTTTKIQKTVDREVDKTLAKISVEGLPPQQLKLMGLQLLGGFSDAEISLISGLSQAQVRHQITAAKLHLLDDQNL